MTTRRKPLPFLSGHCGLTNPPEIHQQCTGKYQSLICRCECHQPRKHCPTCECEGTR